MIEFRINHNDWDLVLTDESRLNGNLGMTIFTDYRILLMKSDKHSNMKSALIHELTHAFRWSYGNIVSDQNKISISAMDLEEIIANVIEAHGRDIIELSDQLWEQIKEELEDDNE